MGRGGDVPDDHRAVATARGQGPTVGRKGERLNPYRVSYEVTGELPAGGHLPERHFQVLAGRCQDPTVGREGQGIDAVLRRSLEPPQEFPVTASHNRMVAG